MADQRDLLDEKLDEERFRVEINSFKREIREMLNEYKLGLETLLYEKTEKVVYKDYMENSLKKYCLQRHYIQLHE